MSTAPLPIAFAPATRVGAFSDAYDNAERPTDLPTSKALPPYSSAFAPAAFTYGVAAVTALPPYSSAFAPAAFTYGVAAVTALPPYSSAFAPIALAAGSATAPTAARPRNKGPPSSFPNARRGDNANPKIAAKALKGPLTIIRNALANPNNDAKNPFSSLVSFLSFPSSPTGVGFFFANSASYFASLAASSCFSSRFNCFSSNVSWSLKRSS